MNGKLKTLLIMVLTLSFTFYTLAALYQPSRLAAKPGHLRIDLRWSGINKADIVYEVQRSAKRSGLFKKINQEPLRWKLFSDFTGKTTSKYYYRVRMLKLQKTKKRKEKNRKILGKGPWSTIVEGRSRRSTPAQFMTEVQAASFRYFYDYAHPVSGLAREGSHRGYDLVAIGVSGFGLFNLGVGVERKFITRQQGAARALKILRFLDTKAQRYHGAFPHWMNGKTGEIIRFGKKQDGVDIVETSFLMHGMLFLREYFNRNNIMEREIRKLADKIWRGVQWNKFVKGSHIMWNWSPTTGWDVLKLKVGGFNEAQITYLLAMASPTHPIKPELYRKGWIGKHYVNERKHYGIKIYLNKGIGPPLFFTHYSYLGFDPKQIYCNGKSYFAHFRALAQVQKKYAMENPGGYKDYGRLWGLTASMGPDGYRAFRPGERDNGTITPTAALSSMPYTPNESKDFMKYLYLKYKGKVWGEFGFFDALNPSRDFYPRKYLGLDTGTIAPMIENYRTGLCWKTFMKAPEIKKLLTIINK
jgi:hypothetical protein